MQGPASVKDERALLVLSVLFGSAAVISYPLALTFGPAMLLMFTVPMALATGGRLHHSRAWQAAAVVVAVALLAALLTGQHLVIRLVLTLGPIAVVYLLGRLLRGYDRLAANVWTVGAVIAFAVGILLLGAAPDGAAGGALLVMTVGLVVALARVRHTPIG